MHPEAARIPMEKIFIVGCGDIGERTAVLWQARANPVLALARSAASAERLRQLGITPVAGDLDAAESLHALPVADAVLYYFAPPPTQGETDPRMHALMAALDSGARPKKIIYISTTGVYGDGRGEWINENTPLRPQAARSKRRVDAESALRAFGTRHAVPVIILRVSGIYGPGRLPIDAIKARRPVLDEKESGYTNRIHADDLARICVAAAERGRADSIYNVSDGQPGTLAGYFNQLADALGEPRPPVITRAEAQTLLSAGMLSYLNESRRIDNRRLRKELGIELLYPTLEAGLAASLMEERAAMDESGR